MRTRKLVLLAILALLLISATLIITATYGIGLWTTNGGGMTSSGGDYIVSGVSGQAEVGPQHNGGNYQLTGGIFHGALQAEMLFLPLITR
jgi:hypothetical protein